VATTKKGAPGAPQSARGRGSQRQKIVLKDWSGGLNNAADITSLGPTEAALLENFEVDANGGLTSRPPIVKVAEEPQLNEQFDHLGYFTETNGVIHVVCATADGTYLWNTVTKVYVKITTIRASGAAQYNDRLYICSKTEPGGYWDGATFTKLDTGALAMPKGEQIVLFKARFWLVSWVTGFERQRVYFSNIDSVGTSPTSVNEWKVDENYFNVSRGDGQWITCLMPGASELFIFRNGSTYYFKYDSSPMSGRLELINANIGADSRRCVDAYEFSYLVLNAGRLYRFVSYNYYPLNDPQKLVLRPESGVGSGVLDVVSAVSVFGRRAVVWYGGATYALDLDQGTWTTWKSPTSELGYMVREPRRENDLTPDVAYGVTASKTNALKGLYRIVDEFNATDSETIVCMLRTKAYDWDVPDSWKLQYYWSADVLTARDVTGRSTPIQLSSSIVTYDDLDHLAGGYDTMEDGTYDALTSKNETVTSVRPFPMYDPFRVNVTFERTMRYRRCFYEVELVNDGTSGSAPNRIVAIAVHVEVKQRISQEIQ